MKSLEEIDYKSPEFGDFYDELPLWSAPLGLLLLEHVPLRPGITILDVGAGTGFLSMDRRCCVITSCAWASFPVGRPLLRKGRSRRHSRLWSND